MIKKKWSESIWDNVIKKLLEKNRRVVLEIYGGKEEKYVFRSGPVHTDWLWESVPPLHVSRDKPVFVATIYNSAVLNTSFTFIDLTYFISISMAVQVQNTTFIRLTFFKSYFK